MFKKTFKRNFSYYIWTKVDFCPKKAKNTHIFETEKYKYNILK